MHTHSQSRYRRTLWARMLATAACAALALGANTFAHAQDNEQRNRSFQKAEALYLSGRLQDAATSFADLTQKYPRDARIWLKYGNTLTKLGNLDEAAGAFQSAANLDATQGNAALNLSLVRLAQAQAALDLALARLAESTPEHAQAQNLQRALDTLLGKKEKP